MTPTTDKYKYVPEVPETLKDLSDAIFNLASTAAMCIPIPKVMGDEQQYEPLFDEDQREDIKLKILILIRDLQK